MNTTNQTADLDSIIAAYSPRVAAAFDLHAEDYEITPDGFTRLLEDAAEAAAETSGEDDLSSENLLQATHYTDNAARPDAVGARYCTHITTTLDEVLTRTS